MSLFRRLFPIALCALVLFGCSLSGSKKTPELSLKLTSFEKLAGWAADDHAAALAAFLRSCDVIKSLPQDQKLAVYGSAGAWQSVCQSAQALPTGADSARQFFESEFVPYSVRAGRKKDGLFTGYYEPELLGSRTRDAQFHVPLLARPQDLVTVELGQFRDTLKGQRIAGRVTDGKLLPYADRRALVAEEEKRPAIAYTDDVVAAFFLQIQGSGRLRLPDNSVIRVGYDGQNGHPYTAIGKVLREREALPAGTVTMQFIRDWLRTHPADADELMNTNASYVFFRELPSGDAMLGPPGAQGVALTPGRSLAIDRAVHAYGVPFFVTADPPQSSDTPLRRLLIGQDTGGAIRGPVRGDVFWGFGAEAESRAGAMQATGQMTALVPRSVAAQIGKELAP